MQNRFLWLLPFSSFLFGYLFIASFLQKRIVVTPCLIGKSIKDSTKSVCDYGLNLRLLREQEDFDLPEGIVLSQIPKPHQKIRPNQHIFITVSKRPHQLCAISIVGKKEDETNEAGKQSGIIVKTYRVPSIYPKGTCVAQSPQEGQEVVRKRLIAYLSSGKSNMAIFPNLKGRPAEEVKEFLSGEGVSVEEVICKLCNKNQNGLLMVLDQKPMAGSIVDMSKPLFVQLQVGGT